MTSFGDNACRGAVATGAGESPWRSIFSNHSSSRMPNTHIADLCQTYGVDTSIQERQPIWGCAKSLEERKFEVGENY